MSNNVCGQCESHQYINDGVCAELTQCTAEVEYEHTPPTPTRDRECRSYVREKQDVLDLLRQPAFGDIKTYIEGKRNANLRDTLRRVLAAEELKRLKKKTKEIQNHLSRDQSSDDVLWVAAFLDHLNTHPDHTPHPHVTDELQVLFNIFHNKCVQGQAQFSEFIQHSDTSLSKVATFLLFLKNHTDLYRALAVFLHKNDTQLADIGGMYVHFTSRLGDVVMAHYTAVTAINLLDDHTRLGAKQRESFFGDLFYSLSMLSQLDAACRSHYPLNVYRHVSDKPAVEVLESKVASLYHSTTQWLDDHSTEELNAHRLHALKFRYSNLREIKKQDTQDILKIGERHTLFISKFDSVIKHYYQHCVTDINQDRMDRVAADLSSLVRFMDIIPDSLNVTAMIESILLKIKTTYGPSRIHLLGVKLSKLRDDEGRSIQFMQTFGHWFGDVLREMRNAVTRKYGIEYVLKEIEGDGISTTETKPSNDGGVVYNTLSQVGSVISNMWHGYRSEPKIVLQTYYTIFSETFDGKLQKAMNAITNTETLKQIKTEIITEIHSLAAVCRPSLQFEWTLKQKDCVPRLSALIFSLWSIEKGLSDKYESLLIPDAAQAVAVFRLLNVDSDDTVQELKNNFAQIGTGEGKSVTLAVSASILSLMGGHVYVACYSEYLTNRDYNDFEWLFKAVGVSDHIQYGTFNALNEMIIGGTQIRKMAYDLVKGDVVNEEHTSAPVTPGGNYSILMIDEVDMFFQPSFYGAFYNPAVEIPSTALCNLAEKIWKDKITSLKELRKTDLYQSTVTSLGKKWERVLISAVTTMLDDVSNFSIPEYEVIGGRIGYKDHDTIDFSKYYPYKTMFAYFHEHERDPDRVTLDQRNNAACRLLLNLGHFSYAELPKKFQNIIGVSGTLSTLTSQERASLRHRYNIVQQTTIPSVFGNKLREGRFKTTGLTVVPPHSHFLRITAEISDPRRAYLIIFENSAKLESYFRSPEFDEFRDDTAILTEETPDSERALIVKRTSQGQITLLTREFSRGTDFVCYDSEVEENGGVHVIQTFFSEVPSEEIQAQGRTCRQGKKGSYSLILNEEDLITGFGLNSRDFDQCSTAGYCRELLVNKRKALYEQALLELESIVVNAQSRHNESVEFLESLFRGNVTKASELLIEFNSAFPPNAASTYHTVMALDVSGSMYYDMDALRKAVLSFFDKRMSIAHLDTLSIILWSDKIIEMTPNIPITPIGRIDLVKKMEMWESNGGTDFTVALKKTMEVLRSIDLQVSKPVLLFMSDGQAPGGVFEMKKLYNEFQSSDLVTYVIAFGSDEEGHKQLSELAAAANGKYLEAVSDVVLIDIFDRLPSTFPVYVR